MLKCLALSPPMVPTLAQDVCGVYGADSAPLRARADCRRVRGDAAALHELLCTRCTMVAVSMLAAEPATARWMRLGEGSLGWCGSAGRRCCGKKR